MKKLLFILCLSGVWFYSHLAVEAPTTAVNIAVAQYSASDAALLRAYKNKQSDLQIKGGGTVIKILPDDLKGSKHQRFIIKLATGQTLLVAHNIDLAPRVDALQEGDKIEFYGEYEWKAKGGVIHWTHHDPGGRHPDGYLIHEGKIYQ